MSSSKRIPTHTYTPFIIYTFLRLSFTIPLLPDRSPGRVTSLTLKKKKLSRVGTASAPSHCFVRIVSKKKRKKKKETMIIMASARPDLNGGNRKILLVTLFASPPWILHGLRCKPYFSFSSLLFLRLFSFFSWLVSSALWHCFTINSLSRSHLAVSFAVLFVSDL